MESFLVHVTTWNVGTNFPDTEDFKQLFGLDGPSPVVADLYIVGFQEVKAQPQNMVWDSLFVDPWTAKAKEVLGPMNLVKINTYRMQGLVTSLFIQRKHLTYVRDMENLLTRRGLGGIWGNKGAVSTRLGLHGCSMCFVNCHLTAHDQYLKERVEDYKAILDGQVFSVQETSNILFHDYVVWLGDLNFRLDGDLTSHDIAKAVSQGQLKTLLQNDQLKNVQNTGDAFSELNEMNITFPPTYKFEGGVDNYDLKRRPGWPDRILYHCNANVYDNVTLKIEGLSYQSHLSYRASDHRPVTGVFRMKVFRPTIEKLIDFVPVEQWRLGENTKVFYRVCPTLETSAEDWIAIFQHNFNSVDEYVAYVYSPQNNVVDKQLQNNTPEEPELSVVFSENSVPMIGRYVLVYFSHSSRSIYGISNEFEVVGNRSE